MATSDSQPDEIPLDYTPILLSPRRYAVDARPSTSPTRRELTQTISPELYTNRAECLFGDQYDVHDELPAKYSYVDHYLQPQNQQLVGVAAVCAELVECRTTALKTYCSAQFIVDKLNDNADHSAGGQSAEYPSDQHGYQQYDREELDHRSDETSTTDITMYQGMAILKQYGCPQQETYAAYHRPNHPLHMGYDAIIASDALEFSIENFASVSTIMCAKYCLVNYGPLAIIVPCYSTTNKQLWRPIGRLAERNHIFTSSIIGYHAMAVVAYDEHGFLLRNSWGTEWGDAGYTHFPYGDWGLQAEVWTRVNIAVRRRLSRAEQPIGQGLLRRIVSAVNSASNSPRSSASSPRTQSSKNSPRSASNSPRDH